MTAPSTFSLTGPLPTGRVVIEASAGTGKTHALAGLVVRYIAEGVPIGDLLVVTGLGSPSYDVHAAGDHDDYGLVGCGTTPLRRREKQPVARVGSRTYTWTFLGVACVVNSSP